MKRLVNFHTCSLALFLIYVLTSDLQAQGSYTLDLDGTDDYVEVPYHAGLNSTTFSVECWVKLAGGAGTWRSPLTSRDDTPSYKRGYMIYAGTDDTWQFWIGNTSNGWSKALSGVTTTTAWTHLAASYDGANLRFYVNGILRATQASTFLVNTGRPLWLGAGGTESATPVFGFFPGKIDEVRIWSDARTQAEIQANMHKKLVGNEANLAAYYSMSNGSGTSLTDNSGNSHTGTLTNDPAWKTSGALAGPRMALDFDGVDDFFYAPLNATATSSITVEGWFSFNSLTNQQNLINIHQTANVDIRFVPFKTASNEVALFVDDGPDAYVVTSTFTITQTDVWHHLVFIYDTGTISIYANGELVGYDTEQGSFSTAATNLFSVGADYDGSDAGWHANIKADEVRIWSDVRTQAEILAYKDRTLDGDEANLLSYYRCDQQPASGQTTVYDYSSNGHNGTLAFMDATTDWVASAPFNTWIGSESSDWSNGENWSQRTAPFGEDIGIFPWAGSNSPISGDISSRNLYIDAGATLSHNGNLNISGNYYNAGTFSISGSITCSGSSAQTIGGSGTSTFGNLIVDNGAGISLDQSLTISGSLIFSNGIVNLNGNTLTLGNAASIGGTPDVANHINATSGSLRKDYSGTGSFAFPVGGASAYSPITLNFTSGAFSSGYATVNLTEAKHGSNTSATDYLTRYWTVSSSGISGFSCDVSAQYANADIMGTENNLHGAKYSSGWLDLGAVTAGSNLITGTVTGFSDFTAGEPSAFPVEWLSFTARPEGSLVRLDWATASELNSDFFAIERSTDQTIWTELGKVSAAGNSTETREYQFEDGHPLSGRIYYRLRQVDLDGSFDFSSVAEIYLVATGISVYPNPVAEKLTIELDSDQMIWAALIDMQGRKVIHQLLSRENQEIDLSQLAAGVYILELSDQKGWNHQQQIVKE